MKLCTAQGTLVPRAPFGFRRSIDFLSRFSPMAGELILDDCSITKGLRLGGRTIAFRVEAEGAVERPRLGYTLFSERPIDEATRQAAASRIAFFLGTDDDVGAFYARARETGDERLGERIASLYGFHHVKFLTPFENAVWAVLGQRNPMPQARKTKQAIVEKYSEPLYLDGRALWAFPEPADFDRVGLEALPSIIRHERRARYVEAVARAFSAQGEEFLRQAPFDDVEAWLESIPGIGEWSSAFILFRGLGRGDRIPLTEPLQRSAKSVYGRSFSQAELGRTCARLGDWKGYWALYLRAA